LKHERHLVRLENLRVMNKALYASLLPMKALTVNFTASGRHGKAEVRQQATQIRILDSEFKRILQIEAHE
jgi:hypothetical protein